MNNKSVGVVVPRLTCLLLHVAFPFSPLLWETARLIRRQVATLKQNPHVTLLPDKRQRLFLMVDVGIDGAAMDTKEASRLIDRVEPIRDNSH